MRKVLTTGLLAGILMVAMAVPALADNGKSEDDHGRADTELEIYVTSTGLTYQSIPLTAVPSEGPFQQLIPVNGTLTTEFGPGAPGYLGGRWWLDANGSGEMDEGDLFFVCPLLGPGY